VELSGGRGEAGEHGKQAGTGGGGGENTGHWFCVVCYFEMRLVVDKYCLAYVCVVVLGLRCKFYFFHVLPPF
jgi:hypothetical protein